MKNKIAILFSFMMVILLTNNIFADGEKTTDKNTNTDIYTQMFYNEIQSKLNYPQEAKIEGKDGFVVLSFKIADDGSLQILDLVTSDEIFKAAVSQSLSEIRLCSHAAKLNKEYNMKFTYLLY